MAKLPGEDALLGGFLTRYEKKGTRESYEISLRQLLEWLRDQQLGHVAAMTGPHFDLYAQRLKSSGLKPTTQRGKLMAIRMFFEYLVESGILKESPVPRGWVPKFESAPVDEPLLSHEQIEALFELAGSDWRGDELQAVVGLAGFDGVKAIDIYRLTADDVRFTENRAYVPVTRFDGSVHRVALSDATSRLMRSIATRRPQGPVAYGSFASSAKGPAVRRDLQRVAPKAGITQPISIRVLIKSYRRNMLESGVHLDVIIDRLGLSPNATRMKALIPDYGPDSGGEAAITRAVQESDARELLAQAEILAGQDGVTPIAPIVIAGAALEMVLRGMCEGREIVPHARQPGIAAYSEALRSRGMMSKHDHAANLACASLRNSAAHGQNDPEITMTRAIHMIRTVALFIGGSGAAEADEVTP